MFFLRYFRDNCILAGVLFDSLYLYGIIEHGADERYIVLDSFRGQTSVCFLTFKDFLKWFIEGGSDLFSACLHDVLTVPSLLDSLGADPCKLCKSRLSEPALFDSSFQVYFNLEFGVIPDLFFRQP